MPAICVCISAPPSSSSVATSPVAALSSGGPARNSLGASSHHHHVVRQARLISTARGRRAMHHRDLRHTHGRHPRLIGEGAAAVDENVRLVVEVGATAFGERDYGSLFADGDLLQAQRLPQTAGRMVPPLMPEFATAVMERTPDT